MEHHNYREMKFLLEIKRFLCLKEMNSGRILFGFCSIFRGWSHDYGKSGTYSKVCETLVHIPVDFVSTQLKWTFIWVWQNHLVYVPRFHILWYVPLSPKFLAENNFLPTYKSWVCRNWGLQAFNWRHSRVFLWAHFEI